MHSAISMSLSRSQAVSWSYISTSFLPCSLRLMSVQPMCSVSTMSVFFIYEMMRAYRSASTRPPRMEPAKYIFFIAFMNVGYCKYKQIILVLRPRIFYIC